MHIQKRSKSFVKIAIEDMNPRTAWLTLLSLLLLAISIESRKDPGEYWTSVMKDQPMPEAIQGLVHSDSAASQPTKNANCDHDHLPSMGTRNKNQPFAEDFEPRPSATAYNDDDVGQEEKKSVKDKDDDAGRETHKKFVKDFEPRPNVSAYNDDDVDQKFVKDFEPRPNVSAYNDDDVDQKFVKDFKPRPNASAYSDDDVDQKFVKDFEPRPDATVYRE